MREIVHARSFKVLLAVVLVLLGMLIFTAGTGSSITGKHAERVVYADAAGQHPGHQ